METRSGKRNHGRGDNAHVGVTDIGHRGRRGSSRRAGVGNKQRKAGPRETMCVMSFTASLRTGSTNLWGQNSASWACATSGPGRGHTGVHIPKHSPGRTCHMRVLYCMEVTPLRVSTPPRPHQFVYCTSTNATCVPGLLPGWEDVAGRKSPPSLLCGYDISTQCKPAKVA